VSPLWHRWGWLFWLGCPARGQGGAGGAWVVGAAHVGWKIINCLKDNAACCSRAPFIKRGGAARRDEGGVDGAVVICQWMVSGVGRPSRCGSPTGQVTKSSGVDLLSAGRGIRVDRHAERRPPRHGQPVADEKLSAVTSF